MLKDKLPNVTIAGLAVAGSIRWLESFLKNSLGIYFADAEVEADGSFQLNIREKYQPQNEYPLAGLEAVSILSESYQRGIKSLFAPYHLRIEVLLTEFTTELVRIGYCPNPVLVSIRARGGGR